MKYPKNLSGLEYGYLKVVSIYETGKNGTIWACLCKCGNTKNIERDALVSGRTKSCGCYHKEQTSKSRLKHGKRHSPEYNSWVGMRDRCYNIKNPKYPRYGERGIGVCSRWLGDMGFVNFYSDMGERPSKNHSLDRIDVNGNYEPTNCRWALPIVQSRNRTDNHVLFYNGEKLSISEWSEITGIKQDTINARVSYYGWSVEEALTIKDGRKLKRKNETDK